MYSLATKVLTNRMGVSAGTQNTLLTSTAAVFGLVLSPFFGGISFNGVEQYWLSIVVLILCASFGGIAFL